MLSEWVRQREKSLGIKEMGADEVRQMMDRLVAAVPHRTRGQASGQILVELAERARERGAVGEEAGLTAKELKHKINERAAKDGSGWLAEKWPGALKLYADAVEPMLISRSRDAGLQTYVRPTKSAGPGNSVTYHFEVVEIPDEASEVSDGQTSGVDEEQEDETVQYVLDMSPKLNWIGQRVFGKGRRLTLRLRLTLMLPLFFFFMFVVVLAGFIVSAMLKAKSPLSMSDLSFAGLVAAAVYFTYKWMDDLTNLVTPKYQMAPWWATAIREGSALLELDEVDTEAGSAYARLKRYTGTCPICDGKVLLDDGKKQFGRRVVGKCQESPDEHIFSFDPKTRMGYPLRQRKDGYVGL